MASQGARLLVQIVNAQEKVAKQLYHRLVELIVYSCSFVLVTKKLAACQEQYDWFCKTIQQA